MPRLLPAVAILATLATPFAQAALAAPAAKPAPAVLTEQQAILPADGPYVVKLQNVRGPVLVRGWNKNVVYVKAEKRATHPLSGTEAGLWAEAAVTLERPEPGHVVAATRFPSQAKALPSVVASKTSHIEVAYTVMLPPEAALELSQEAGNVTVVGVDGRLQVTTRDGALSIAQAKGRVEATTERGDIRLKDIQGDAVIQTLHGQVFADGVTGDLQAKTSTGDVWVTVPPRYAADVSFQTVRGVFRSDLATFQTDMNAGETGYVGILRGPLALNGAPDFRVVVDTVSGTLQIASERTSNR
jgi:hypothetical protein